MREIAFVYIVHLFINSCSIVMGNQAAQNEFQQQQQYQQQLRNGARGVGSTELARDDDSVAASLFGAADNLDLKALGEGSSALQLRALSQRTPAELQRLVADVANVDFLDQHHQHHHHQHQLSAAPHKQSSNAMHDGPSALSLPYDMPNTTQTTSLPAPLDPSSDVPATTSSSTDPTHPPFPPRPLSHPVSIMAHTPPTLTESSSTPITYPFHRPPLTDADHQRHDVSASPPTTATTAATASTPPTVEIRSANVLLHHQHKSYELSHSHALPQIKQHQPHLPKVQRTDAPMLNHIFDTIGSANKHHHHDHRYGPHFEDIYSDGNVTNITAQVGSTVYLNCRISLLQDKTVSWVRRRSGDTNLDLLTVGKHTYSGDPRYKIEFQYPNNWRLKIDATAKDDEGTYECQISTHPPRIIQMNLYVNDPKVRIIDETGVPLQDKYYEVDSTLQLSCIIRQVAMKSSVVFWSHGEKVLNYDTNRGGVSVKTEIMEKGANSTLFIAKINKSDSGNYTCSINSSHDFTVLVHVLNGESFAELHHGSSPPSFRLIDSGCGGTGMLVGLILVHYLLRPIVAAAFGREARCATMVIVSR